MNFFLVRKLKKIGKRAEPSRDFDILLRHKLADAGFAPFARPSFAPLWKTAGATFGIAAMTFSGTGVYAYASDNVLPGDALYEVRQQIEAIEESVARSPERRETVKIKHLERRAKEARLLLVRNKPFPPLQAALVVQRLADVIREDPEPEIPDEAEEARIMIKENRAEMAELIEISNEDGPDSPLKPMIQKKILERMAAMEDHLRMLETRRELERRRKKMLGSGNVKPLEFAPPEPRGFLFDPR